MVVFPAFTHGSQCVAVAVAIRELIAVLRLEMSDPSSVLAVTQLYKYFQGGNSSGSRL